MLRLDRVGKRVGRARIIDEVSLHVGPGEIVCVTGPSGAGKTTLLEIMAGLLAPDTGRVEREVPLSLAFQDDALLPWLSAGGNMDYALSLLPGAERKRRALYWLDRFGLDGRARPETMSGGMRRRLNLARAFAQERPLLLLDEPYAFLDRPWQDKVTDEVRRLAAEGGAVVMISHQTEALENLPCRMLPVTAAPIRLDD